LHTVTNGQYGFHHDELATLDDARSLARAMSRIRRSTPFLARIAFILFGPSRFLSIDPAFYSFIRKFKATQTQRLWSMGARPGEEGQRTSAWAPRLAKRRADHEGSWVFRPVLSYSRKSLQRSGTSSGESIKRSKLMVSRPQAFASVC
jgi:hypothetical protein